VRDHLQNAGLVLHAYVVDTHLTILYPACQLYHFACARGAQDTTENPRIGPPAPPLGVPAYAYAVELGTAYRAVRHAILLPLVVHDMPSGRGDPSKPPEAPRSMHWF